MAHDLIVFKHHLANNSWNDSALYVIARELPYRLQVGPLRYHQVLDAFGQGAPKYRGTEEARQLADCRKGFPAQVIRVSLWTVWFGEPSPLSRDHRWTPYRGALSSDV